MTQATATRTRKPRTTNRTTSQVMADKHNQLNTTLPKSEKRLAKTKARMDHFNRLYARQNEFVTASKLFLTNYDLVQEQFNKFMTEDAPQYLEVTYPNGRVRKSAKNLMTELQAIAPFPLRMTDITILMTANGYERQNLTGYVRTIFRVPAVREVRQATLSNTPATYVVASDQGYVLNMTTGTAIFTGYTMENVIAILGNPTKKTGIFNTKTLHYPTFKLEFNHNILASIKQ